MKENEAEDSSAQREPPARHTSPLPLLSPATLQPTLVTAAGLILPHTGAKTTSNT